MASRVMTGALAGAALMFIPQMAAADVAGFYKGKLVTVIVFVSGCNTYELAGSPEIANVTSFGGFAGPSP